MTLRRKVPALEWHRCSKTHELSIDQWMSCHSHYQTSQREGREREVRLLWYPCYCLVQTLHNISLALVCWVIATSNHQTFEVTARVSWCLISLGSLNLPFSSAMLFARLPVPNILLFAIVVITGTLSKTCLPTHFDIFQAAMHTDSWFNALVFFSIGGLFERYSH